MKKGLRVFLVIASLMLIATSALATRIQLNVDTYGEGDGWTGFFNQMQLFANTTTTQFGDPANGPVPLVGDTFSDFGNLNITSFTGLSGDDEGLGVAGSTGTAYSLTGTWNNLTGYVGSSTYIGAGGIGYLQTSVYTGGDFSFYIDADVDQDFGSTVFADDDTNFGLDGNAELIATLSLVSGSGTNTFNADGEFVSGSSKINTSFTWMKTDFWYDTLGMDIYQEYFLNLGWDINADIDQNTDNVVINPIFDDGVLFQIGSDHDGSIELNVVPEPSTFFLLGAGLIGLGFIARKRSRS